MYDPYLELAKHYTLIRSVHPQNFAQHTVRCAGCLFAGKVFDA